MRFVVSNTLMMIIAKISKQNDIKGLLLRIAHGWKAKIQQTKMLVTCQSFGDLFLFGLV